MGCLDLDDTEAEILNDEEECREFFASAFSNTKNISVERKERIARKDYYCANCRTLIKAGSKYIDYATIGARTRYCVSCKG